ncbi:MAG TPA: hypothetical protein VGF67_25975 [Ktedonobacteraceae bacterium]|jgi:hypothetical protein
MMSLCKASLSTRLDIRCLPAHALLENDDFATLPVLALSPARLLQRKDEEEVYTSFEEAIRERAARISRQLSSRAVTAQLAPAAPNRLSCCWQTWRRTITMTCLALSLLLAGFDLMGLLIILR